MSSTSETGLTVTDPRGSLQRYEVCNNLPTDPSPELLQEFSLLRENIHLTIAWASKLANSALEEKLASGELRAEDSDDIESYRRKAMNVAFDKRATWLTPSVRTNISLPLYIRNGVLTPNAQLASIGMSHNSGVTEVVRHTIEDIKKGSLESPEKVYYCNPIVSINFDTRTKSLDATLQTVGLSTLKVTNRRARNYSRIWTFAWIFDIVRRVTKSLWMIPAKVLDLLLSMIPEEAEEIHLESEISRVQYEFSNDMFMELRDAVTQTVQATGMDHGRLVDD